MNLLVLGLGPHTKKVYWSFLKKYKDINSIRLCALIELDDQRNKVSEFFRSEMKDYQFNEVLFFPANDRNTLKLSDLQKRELNRILNLHGIDSVLIGTEAKSHLQYLKWAIENNLNILVDKPIFALPGLIGSKRISKKYYSVFKSLLKKYINSKAVCNVMCQRRFHEGYELIRQELSKVVEEFNVPITYIDVFHSDGMWNMPNEYLIRDNHPYKYGYGKLMHSGYHFIDLVNSIRDINRKIIKGKIDSDLVSKAYFPSDFVYSFNKDFYKKVFGEKVNIEQKQLRKFGELDVNFLMQDKVKNQTITTIMVSLLQNSFSRRAWHELPVDTYKSNGRIRHERITIEVGPLLNIQLHSYQAYQPKDKENYFGVGHEDHFDIYFFRNSQIIGGKSLEVINLGDNINSRNKNNASYLGQNEEAREICFQDFLNYRRGKSDLQNHESTNHLISKLYESIATKNKTIKFSRPY